LQSANSELRSNIQHSFNATNGLTNIDLTAFSRMQTQLNNAAQSLSGDDAKVAQAMKAHIARVQTSLQRFQTSMTALRGAKVLGTADLTDRKQIADRRNIVNDFLAANQELAMVATNCAANLQADLVRLRVSPSIADRVMANFQREATRTTELTLKIRECDDQVGHAMLELLDLLEAQWGRWTYDRATDKISFQDPRARSTYQEHLTDIKAAGERQVQLQKNLIQTRL